MTLFTNSHLFRFEVVLSQIIIALHWDLNLYFPPSDHHLQGSGLLQGRVPVQPGSVQSGFSFLQLAQGLLDLRL